MIYCPRCTNKRVIALNEILSRFKCLACWHIFHYRPLDVNKEYSDGGNNA